jgi:uncharacterized SAM-binding protein YcdF (DUF218 family)
VFFLKKLLSQILEPMPLCLLLCFAGIALLWWSKRQKTGKIFVTTGLLLLTLLSLKPISDALLGPLERQYPVLQTQDATNISYVVVLGGGHSSAPSIPLISQLSNDSLKRLVEGIRIHREHPQSKLVLSGGNWLDPVPNAKLMADAALMLGVNEANIILESESKDTRDEARLLKPLLGTNRFILVTSASHMPRAMKLLLAERLQPEPAPVAHRIKSAPVNFGTFAPDPGCLINSEFAVHEYLGLAWSKIAY